MSDEHINTIDLLNTLEKDGLIKRLIQDGFLSTKTILFREAYLEYDKLVRTQKITRSTAITQVAESFHISEPYMYRIVKRMRPCIK